MQLKNGPQLWTTKIFHLCKTIYSEEKVKSNIDVAQCMSYNTHDIAVFILHEEDFP